MLQSATYFKEQQFKILAVFSPIIVVDLKKLSFIIS